jgi:hypothetical protein
VSGVVVGGWDFVVAAYTVTALDRRTREHRVRAVGKHAPRAALLEHLGRLDQRSGGVDHVVHDHAVAVLDLADDVHHLGHVGLGTALVDDRQVAAELLGQRARAHHAADVGRDDDEVGVVLALQIRQQHR